jgi:hypothetical protein
MTNAFNKLSYDDKVFIKQLEANPFIKFILIVNLIHRVIG